MLNLSFAQEMTTRKDEKEKEKKHGEGLWRTPAVGPVSQNKMSVG